MNKEDYVIKLERHDTRDINKNSVNGSLTVIWRDWDKILKNEPKMVYVSSVNSGEIKGPHLHTKRDSYFTCIHGRVTFVIKSGDEYIEIESDAEKPILVYVPKNIASAHINTSGGISRVLALANIAWKPNDNEMRNINFDNFEWSKFKK
jgi:dTDP-4-dehydrorhamnose 3,5-epimerase|tara:strand:- start:2565 stop:3011 length:447 start_codon:yes stop_codon:yes gene_type:complete